MKLKSLKKAVKKLYKINIDIHLSTATPQNIVGYVVSNGVQPASVLVNANIVKSLEAATAVVAHEVAHLLTHTTEDTSKKWFRMKHKIMKELCKEMGLDFKIVKQKENKLNYGGEA